MIRQSEASCDHFVSDSVLDAAAITHPPPPASLIIQTQRSELSQRSRRSKREQQKKVRYELLHAMTAEKRNDYLNQETVKKQEIQQRLKQAAAVDSSNQRIAIDLGFDSIMNDKEVRSLANQLKFCYGAIKKMPEPFQLIFCNPSERLEHFLERFGASHWHVQWRRDSTSVADHFEPDQLVYLSPDSPNVLNKIDPEKIYVVGGIVDRSRKKGATLNAALEAGVTTVRLPIQEYIPERLDHILNVNTVLDVLILSQDIDDWTRVLELALPRRKRSQVGRKAMRRRQKQQAFQASFSSAQPKNAVPHQPVEHTVELGGDVTERLEEGLPPTEELSLWLKEVA
uniref:tRNA (guanine(9)-N(1))-methyltransferase n=1 Tax=Peronospora matthiolae TaxID=2874970 RepID=A0AAV1VPA9_9STRA